MQRRIGSLLLGGFLVSLLPSHIPANAEEYVTHVFEQAIDGLSVNMDEDRQMNVRGWDGRAWTAWQELYWENEQDPRLKESNLVLFPRPVTSIHFSEEIPREEIHPIRIATAPAAFRLAAAGRDGQGSPRILRRTEWGADESLLVDKNGGDDRPADVAVDNGTNGNAVPSPREEECRNAYAKFPDEFRRSVPVTRNARGETLRWAQEYSPQVRMLVVHHTALTVTGDERTGLERMRALYEYHARNRGWGDVGYHYIIDEAGQIYEGRAGGDSVIGGHVYCNNVGTIGVSLMGNFEKEQPTQEQAKSAQWLLRLLADKYQINLQRNVIFHGKVQPSIVGHRDLISTECPGYTMWNSLDQLRGNVRDNRLDAAVAFLPPPTPVETTEISEEEERGIITASDGLAAMGSMTLQGHPGAEILVPIYYRAPKVVARNARIARVVRTTDVAVWQELEGDFKPVRGDLRLPLRLKQNQSVLLRVKVRLPLRRGNAAMKIGSISYTLNVQGRVSRGVSNVPASWTRGEGSNALLQTQRSAPSSRPPRRTPASVAGVIRIRLTSEVPLNGTTCEGSTVRMVADGGITRVEGYFRSSKRFRGNVECAVIDNRPTLINEVSLEDYLAGLAEEPDTELPEKQQAFAIAARTYALFYTNPKNRKFPGKPYDGSDLASEFQLYGGVDFEERNPQWGRAVRETQGQVLTHRGAVIKPPYFSQSDGRTRTPAEAGWKDFPFPDIFSSKPDPWCAGMTPRGHGVGMSGCGAMGQAKEGKTAEQILQYYYPGTDIRIK